MRTEYLVNVTENEAWNLYPNAVRVARVYGGFMVYVPALQAI